MYHFDLKSYPLPNDHVIQLVNDSEYTDLKLVTSLAMEIYYNYMAQRSGIDSLYTIELQLNNGLLINDSPAYTARFSAIYRISAFNRHAGFSIAVKDGVCRIGHFTHPCYTVDGLTSSDVFGHPAIDFNISDPHFLRNMLIYVGTVVIRLNPAKL